VAIIGVFLNTEDCVTSREFSDVRLSVDINVYFVRCDSLFLFLVEGFQWNLPLIFVMWVGI